MAGLDITGLDGYVTQPDYQLANMWYLLLEDYAALDLHIVSMEIPFPQIEWGSTDYGMLYAEKISIENSMSLTFREGIRFSSYNFFARWMNDIFDFDKGVFKIGFMDQAKSASIVFVQRPSYPSDFGGNVAESATPLVPTKVFNIAHILPVGFGGLSLDQESGEPLQFTISLKFDHMTSPFYGDRIMKLFKVPTELFPKTIQL